MRAYAHMCVCMCRYRHTLLICLIIPGVQARTGTREAQDPEAEAAHAQGAGGAVPQAATRGRPQPSNYQPLGGKLGTSYHCPTSPARAVRPPTPSRPSPWEDSPKKAPEEGHVDEGREEAEVEKCGGIYTAGGGQEEPVREGPPLDGTGA